MKVFLRAFNITDGEIIYPWLLDNDVQFLTGGNTYFASKDYTLKWLEEKIFNTKNIYLAICLTDTKEMIGYLSINDIDHLNRKAVWGGLLIGNKDYWNKGIATEAAALMLKYVFEELNINLFWAFWFEEHVASIKMGKKIGFKKVGDLPQSVYKGGEYHNQIIMCILKDEYDLMRK